ncbi:hypothetical protein GGI25_000632 [Coemansia spiralis]|uniref:DUF4743 domain-containing protein n=2 Tax=Coemansia TaxID=4863 RepID=A0A9W8KZD8_9FUNG|nr:hypothetical protein BX070DRAFT_247822 [Coemansia spiralis]KAJ1996087.1 hypothetical protein EDC05_000456 [Coemansia umbellata]KAJ2625530.1 hypothetical protein GGI26_000671 [Coemansia sp. RSA 1358]KAJ2680658.1 hypothetical protein GGI25_000632 [Coemansia spiralis]
MTDEYLLLEIVKLCNTVPGINTLISAEKACRFLLNDGTLVGVLSNTDIALLEAECAKYMEPLFVFDHSLRTVVFSALYDTQEKRSVALAEILSNVRTEHKQVMLAKWCNEIFPVYGDKSQPNEVAVWMKRADSFNFGILELAIKKREEEAKAFRNIATRVK